MKDFLNNDWWGLLESEFEKPYYQELRTKLIEEYKTHKVYPKPDDIYRSLKLTPYSKARAVILGQDPYHGEGQAMGLSFSVPKGIKFPPSLENIFSELKSDIGITPSSGDLTPWAKQGVLLLNASLSVRANQALSHSSLGWERLTDRIISILSEKTEPVVFILWGAYAKKKSSLISSHHHIITSAHPSPLSAYRGFFGSKPFSKTNAFLKSDGLEVIDWQV